MGVNASRKTRLGGEGSDYICVASNGDGVDASNAKRKIELTSAGGVWKNSDSAKSDGMLFGPRG